MERKQSILKKNDTKWNQMKRINHILSKKFVINSKKNLLLIMTLKNTIKFKITVITQENIDALFIIFATWGKKYRNKFLWYFKYDYHFITVKVAEKFKEQFQCLGKTTEKYITFSVTIEKTLKIIRQLIQN